MIKKIFSSDYPAKWVGKNFIELPWVASTNVYATSLLAKSKPSAGTVISTFDQQAGLGQFGSKWHSTAGKNVTMSIIFYPEFLEVQQQFLLSQFISLAVLNVILENGIKDATIKWPNDIYVADRKVSGILIQNSLLGNKFHYCIVGIGLNVNQEHFPSLLPNPTSMKLETGVSFDLYKIIAQLCLFVEREFENLKRGETEKIKEKYSSFLYKKDVENYFSNSDGSSFSGIIRGVNIQGQLLIEMAEGHLRPFSLKEISYR